MIWIDCSLPVALSLADTFTMPLASMSKVTSICGHAARRGRNADQLEAAERLVVGRHLALALQHVDRDRRLAVGGGREDLALARGDGGVLLDQLGHDAAERLDAERQRGHVEQQHVLDVALQHGALDGGAHGHDLVGVDALVGLLAEDPPHPLLRPRACASCRRPGSPRRSRAGSGPRPSCTCGRAPRACRAGR